MSDPTSKTTIQQLIGGYQDRLVAEINDPRNFASERDGLRMAAALFRSELTRLRIPNVPVKEQSP